MDAENAPIPALGLPDEALQLFSLACLSQQGLTDIRVMLTAASPTATSWSEF